MRWWKTKTKPLIRAGAFTDVGQVRSQNQDNYGQYTRKNPRGHDEHLFIVADGMGGHEHGEEASRLAVDEVCRVFYADASRSVGARLRHAFEAANACIYERAHANGTPQGRTMGTTCTALVLTEGQAILAHVGDSRAYRISGGAIEQITHDHTVVDELYRNGVLTAGEARQHPQRHTLTRALGTQAAVSVDVLDPRPVQSRERYLLCSDGLAPVSDAEVLQVVEAHVPQAACERLVQMANDRGGPDNVSVVIVAIG